MKLLGYLVTETCEDYEQVLGLRHDDTTPPAGVLDWTDGPRALFSSRVLAKQAIDRTEHYRLAFGLTEGANSLPEKRLCKIVPVAAA